MKAVWRAGAILISLACLAASGTAQEQPAGKRATKSNKAAPAMPVLPPAPMPSTGDIAYGAYQRGLYLTALAEATKRAEAVQDPKSMTLIAEIYLNGNGVKQDEKKAAEWYRLAADRGDREAQFGLGLLHLTGRGVARDRAEAARRFQAAADRGYAPAAYNLALLYVEGQTLPRDAATAAKWFRAAADQDLADAQYALAGLYEEGSGVEKSQQEAVR
jgi:hypothetical protein